MTTHDHRVEALLKALSTLQADADAGADWAKRNNLSVGREGLYRTQGKAYSKAIDLVRRLL